MQGLMPPQDQDQDGAGRSWAQRFTEPTVASNELKHGAYVYFDYNIMHDDMQVRCGRCCLRLARE
jgi:hypothetical protein